MKISSLIGRIELLPETEDRCLCGRLLADDFHRLPLCEECEELADDCICLVIPANPNAKDLSLAGIV